MGRAVFPNLLEFGKHLNKSYQILNNNNPTLNPEMLINLMFWEALDEC